MANTTTEAASHGADALGTCIDAHGGAIGMPQLCGEWVGNQVFWLLITLVAIYFILTRIALPRIEAVLSERSGTITNDLAAAEELKQKAVEAEDAYNKALADARAQANRIVADARAEIKADLDKATARADVEISAKTAESEKAIGEIRAGAMEAIVDVAKTTALDIVDVMGSKADAKTVSAAVDAQLKG